MGSHFNKHVYSEHVPMLHQLLATSKGRIRPIIVLKCYAYDQHLEQPVTEIYFARSRIRMYSELIFVESKPLNFRLPMSVSITALQ